MSTAWVVRAGKHGEREAWVIENGYAGTGWVEFADLAPYANREALAELVTKTLSDRKQGAIPTYVGQLWALRGRIEAGDLMVLPMKTTKQIAIGRVTGSYRYLADSTDLNRHHVVPVEWVRTDIPRTAVKQDLLFTLGSALTVFAPTKNNALARLQALMATGTDPGQVPSINNLSRTTSSGGTSAAGSDFDSAVDEPEMVPDIEETAQTQITAKLQEEYAGHDLTTLVTALLKIDGFVCRQSPPGPDGGIDIIAGRGLLGLDSPIIVVQVKSGGPVGAPVVQQLHGVMAQHDAAQGLLVAWGGLSKPARDQVQNLKMRVRLWEASDVVDAVLKNYDALPEDIRAKVPLKQVWMLSTAATD